MAKQSESQEHPHFKRFTRECITLPFYDERTSSPVSFAAAALRAFTALNNAQIYADELKPDAVRDYGKKPYAAFRRALRVGLLQLDQLANSKSPAVQSLNESSDIGPHGHVKLLYHHLPQRRKLMEKLRDMRLNIGHLDKWRTVPFISVAGDFLVKPRLFTHPESPMSLTITVPRESYKHKPFIGTLGFQLLQDNGGTVLSINNLQGVKGEKTRLDAFSKQVGEPWQIYLAKRAIEYARVNGFKVEGQLPWPFHKDLRYTLGIPDNERDRREYARQVGHYEKTFHNLGMKKGRGKWVLPTE